MKKRVLWIPVVIMGLSLSLAGCDACKENLFTKLGDKIATMGKSGLEKDKILMGRAADRAGKCTEQQGGAFKKKLGI